MPLLSKTLLATSIFIIAGIVTLLYMKNVSIIQKETVTTISIQDVKV